MHQYTHNYYVYLYHIYIDYYFKYTNHTHIINIYMYVKFKLAFKSSTRHLNSF